MIDKVKQVTLIEGDGIGPEIAAATIDVVAAAGGQIEWERVPAGLAAVELRGTPLPEDVLTSIEKNGVALKGPLGTPVGEGFRSVNVGLRQYFDLYANVRPAKTLPGVPSRFTDVDMVIVRENTEGLYSGVEHFIGKRDAAEAIAIITRAGSERIIRYAFEYARRHARHKVTLVHKANILKMAGGLFLEVGREVAAQYPDIEFNDMIVDATAMRMVTDPQIFDVIVTTNLFGDILSDLAAGLIGGLGVAGSANLGTGGCAIFEAVHGTAPDIAGQGIANPTALMLSAVLLLEYLDQDGAANRLRRGIMAALADPGQRMRDLGGIADTATFTRAVIRHMAH